MSLIVFMSCLVLIDHISPPMSLLFHTFLSPPFIANLLAIFFTVITSPPHSQVSFSIAAATLLLTPGTVSYLFPFYPMTSISIVVLLNLPNSYVPSTPDLSFALVILLLSQNSLISIGLTSLQ